MQVNEKTRQRVPDPVRLPIAEAIRAVRRRLGYTQEQLAHALESSQGAITRWERGIDRPPPRAAIRLAKLVPEAERPYWLGFAGVVDAEAKEDSAGRSIPLLRDPAAAGTPRAVDEREIEQRLLLPKEWLPRGGSLFAVKVSGESMAPILLDGHIVIVDVSKRQADKLVRRMVVARDTDGVTIKWLRRSKEIYSLVPQHVAPEYEVQYLQPLGDFVIVGEVVMWIGTPPPARK